MKQYKELLDAYLTYQSANPFKGKPNELYDPTNYILSLGGKRVRPLMVLLGFQLFDDQLDKALPLAHSVEVFHNFTLMHDDIMDQASVRRGKLTIHKRWNENIAILSGDLMLVKAYRILSEMDTETSIKQELTLGFGKMAEEVCVGQQFDMNFEVQSVVTEEEYLEMITLKTSVLLAYSLQAGSILGGADKSVSDELYLYGLNIGLAFQVMDDYLDTFGDAKTFGKKIGGDILENKKTLLLIEANKRANSDQLKELSNWFSITEESEEKIKAVTALYRKLDVDRYAEAKMDYFFEHANNRLANLPPDLNVMPLQKLAQDLQLRRS